MSHLRIARSRMSAAALSAVLVIASHAQADYVVNNFDSADEVAAWYFEGWSTATATASWDPTMDSLGNPNSGSMKIEIDFDAASQMNDANFTRQLPTPLNAAPAYLFIADVMVSDDSPDTPWGDEGFMQIVGRNGDDWAWTPQIADNINSHGAWVPFDRTPAEPFDDLRAVTFQLWGGGDQALQGRTTLWLDNIQFLGDFPEPSQPGDTDGDLDVDIVDLNNVRNNFGADNPPLGDTDGDGDVDIEDLNAVRNNFGAGPVAQAPEPGAAALAICCIGALLALRRRMAKRSSPHAH